MAWSKNKRWLKQNPDTVRWAAIIAVSAVLIWGGWYTFLRTAETATGQLVDKRWVASTRVTETRLVYRCKTNAEGDMVCKNERETSTVWHGALGGTELPFIWPAVPSGIQGDRTSHGLVCYGSYVLPTREVVEVSINCDYWRTYENNSTCELNKPLVGSWRSTCQ